MRPRILLLGKNGQIGFELERFLSEVGEVRACDRGQLDVCNQHNLRALIRREHPEVLVNAAAYTGVDHAESDENRAHDVNGTAPGIMAEETRKIDALLVHYSTDYIFDGLKRCPYREADLPNPLNAYGRTKLAGEQAIREARGRHLILRTAWVYSTRGRNFLLTVLRLASQYEEFEIVHDQTGAPTWSREIGRATTLLLKSIFNREDPCAEIARVTGTYHMTAGGSATWWDFAQAILDEARRFTTNVPWIAAATGTRPLIATKVSPTTTDQYPTAARRPAYSVLSTDLLKARFGVFMPHWREQLRAVFASACKGQ